jgi:hypothetical protein
VSQASNGKVDKILHSSPLLRQYPAVGCYPVDCPSFSKIADLILDIEETYSIGKKTFYDSVSHKTEFAVVFEDNRETGYFYALTMQPEQEILDGLHVYDVENVVDRHIPSKLQIVWSDDGLIASLLINNFCHAIFDFENKAGYCRNGFPESRTIWTSIKERKLTDKLIEKIFENRS